MKSNSQNYYTQDARYSPKSHRSVAGAKAILEENQQTIYHLSTGKYPNLSKALKLVKSDLLRILSFCKKHDPIIYKQRYTWFLDTNKLTYTVRKKTTRSTSNAHFNYLCAIGALTKIHQYNDDITGINATHKLNSPDKDTINTFSIPRYTEQRLERMEQRAKRLYSLKITPSNISHDKLLASGCRSIAKSVYYTNSNKALDRKKEQWEKLQTAINTAITSKGYTTKAETAKALKISRIKLDKLITTFRLEWDRAYIYKAPNAQERNTYALENKSWIITRRDADEKGD